MHPRRTLLAALAVLSLLTAPASAFEVYRHANMTAEVFAAEGVPGGALAVIVHGVTAPDLMDCVVSGYCPEWLPLPWEPTEDEIRDILSTHHFDNNRISQSVDYVNDRIFGARAAVEGNSVSSFSEMLDYVAALFRFGQGLHALQDFYAHSTWMECQTDLLRIGGRPENVALWDGNPGNGCGATVQGISLSGLQTGYFGLPVPGDGISHDLLNKDNATTPQGAIEVRRIFPATLIGTYYEICSGQFGGGAYQSTGLAPRHTIKAWQSFLNGTVVFNAAPPFEPAGDVLHKTDILALMQSVDTHPDFVQIVAEIEALRSQYDGSDPTTYPSDLFTPDGIPTTLLGTGVGDRPAALQPELRAYPNPFNPRVTVELPGLGATASVRVFDARGRLVRSLHEGFLPARPATLVWDGMDAGGRSVASGSYWIVLESGGHRRGIPVALVR